MGLGHEIPGRVCVFVPQQPVLCCGVWPTAAIAAPRRVCLLEPARAAPVHVLLTASDHAFLQEPVIFFQSFT
jgi:hypothetical protein